MVGWRRFRLVQGFRRPCMGTGRRWFQKRRARAIWVLHRTSLSYEADGSVPGRLVMVGFLRRCSRPGRPPAGGSGEERLFSKGLLLKTVSLCQASPNGAANSESCSRRSDCLAVQRLQFKAKVQRPRQSLRRSSHRMMNQNAEHPGRVGARQKKAEAWERLRGVRRSME